MSHDHDSKLLFMIFNSRDSKDHIPTAQGNINAFWLIYIIGFAIFKHGIHCAVNKSMLQKEGN